MLSAQGRAFDAERFDPKKNVNVSLARSAETMRRLSEWKDIAEFAGLENDGLKIVKFCAWS